MNEPFKIVIVEDEPISTAYLKKMLKETGIEHQIVGELDSVSESMLFFGKNPYYDLVFMDIHLGDGTCFELLDAKVIEKPIIFCTTFDNYAIQAFKYNSIDYLLKPASQDDIDTAMDKFMNMKNNGEATYFERMDKMLSSLKEPRHKKRFLIKKDNHLELIEAKNIVYFYSEAGHTFLVNNKGEEFLVEFTLERLEELIDPDLFFRINRKATLNIDYIATVKDYINNRLKVDMRINDDFDFIVSRNRVKEFKTWLKGIS